MTETLAHRSAGLRPVANVEGSGAVLQLIRSGSANTVSELASAMGVSRSTAHQRTELLRGVGLVHSAQAAPGLRGRPPALAVFNHRAGLVLAVHAGLTGSRVAVTDLRGDVLAERFVHTDLALGMPGLLERVEPALDLMRAEVGAGLPVVGVGLGLPSSVETRSYARSLGYGDLDWEASALAERLRRRYGAPVFVDHDVNLLALAERRRSWPDAEVVVCVKLGTLIDAAIVVNNEPVRGAGGFAGQLGHFKVEGSTAPCTCGAVGCLDVVASGSALVKLLAQAGFAVSDVPDVVALARAGEPAAVSAVREAGRLIGDALAAVVNIVNPAVIVAWGYLTEVEVPLFAGIREGLYQKALPASSRDLVLKSASFGELAGVRGAAMLVLDEVLEAAAVDRMLVRGSWSEIGAERSSPVPQA